MRANPKNHFLMIVLLAATLGLLDAAMAGPRVSVAEVVRAAFAAPDLAGLAIIHVPEQEARFVRLVIRSADGAVGIDELAVFGPASDENLALASRGAIAHASSVIAGHPIHAIAHLNDGLYGNDHSWIAATPGEEWAEIELPKATRVARVGFTRDRTGAFTDRQARDVEVRLSLDGTTWQTAARQSQATRLTARPAERLTLPASALPEPSWQGIVNYAFLRERDTWSRLDAQDYLSPLLHDRPTEPGGTPYWGRLARLAPVAR
ncbi:MAG: discoidin domain-containing protein, partial [Verrucomicrobia bacterium]|nr:discoidin domain-containing protein [Verrucomicrobiota bacterium]